MLPAFFKLIRPLNLLIIGLTQVLLHYFLIIPLLSINDSYTSLSTFQFILLVAATLLIAASGYVINDIKDIKVDLINKPSKVIITNQISRANGLKIYAALTSIGILLSIYLAYSINLIALGSIHFLSAGLLFFYSTSYKKIFLLGTFIISLITALSIIIVMLFDMNALSNSVIIKFVAVYALFAFLITFVREILKDVEDMEGDSDQNAATLPIIAGINTSKIITAFIIGFIITILLVVGRFMYYIQDYISLIYVCVAVIIPLFLLLYYTINATEKNHFASTSKFAKLIMVLGILYIAVFYYVLTKS